MPALKPATMCADRRRLAALAPAASLGPSPRARGRRCGAAGPCSPGRPTRDAAPAAARSRPDRAWVSPSKSAFSTPGRWPSTSPSSEPPPFSRESISEKIDTMRMPRSRETRSQAVSIARKWRGLPWKFETMTLRKPCAASERPRSSSTRDRGRGPERDRARAAARRRRPRRRTAASGTCAPDARSGRKRSVRSARPSPSSTSAPSGRCGPCTSSGEQVTNTTALSRSIVSNCALGQRLPADPGRRLRHAGSSRFQGRPVYPWPRPQGQAGAGLAI